MATLEAWVPPAPQGWYAEDLADRLHVNVHDPLHELVRQGRVRRTSIAGRLLYTAAEARRSKDQIRARRTAHAVPLVTDASALHVSPDELKAAILLFYSLLDEQQRRLFAGLESIKLGLGGDTILATFLNLDAHTVARGRQQLLDHDVAPGRVRREGGGRPPRKKNGRSVTLIEFLLEYDNGERTPASPESHTSASPAPDPWSSSPVRCRCPRRSQTSRWSIGTGRSSC
jgi:hypothetical protein